MPTGHYKAKSSISKFYFDLFYPLAAKARFQKSSSFKVMGKRRSVILRTGMWDGLGGEERERGRGVVGAGGGGGGEGEMEGRAGDREIRTHALQSC